MEAVISDISTVLCNVSVEYSSSSLLSCKSHHRNMILEVMLRQCDHVTMQGVVQTVVIFSSVLLVLIERTVMKAGF